MTAYLAALSDAADDDDNLRAVADLLADLVAQWDAAGEDHHSVNDSVTLVAAFAEVIAEGHGDDDYDSSNNASTVRAAAVLTANFAAALEAVGQQLAGADYGADEDNSSETVVQFVQSVGTFATWAASSSAFGNFSSVVDVLEGALANACAAATSADDGNNNQQFVTAAFSVTCARAAVNQSVWILAAAPSGSGQGAVRGTKFEGSITVSAWNATAAEEEAGGLPVFAGAEAEVLVSDVVGVTARTADGKPVPSAAAANIDGGFNIDIGLRASAVSTGGDGDGGGGGGGGGSTGTSNGLLLPGGLRCKYWDTTGGVGGWKARGIVLLGMAFDPKSTLYPVEALCVSAHLTLFATSDDSAATRLLDAKVRCVSVGEGVCDSDLFFRRFFCE